MSFANKVILVTGASSGIGADAARHLAKLGGKVALVGRNEKKLKEVVEQIKTAGNPSAISIVADITKDAQRIIDETIKKFGQLDVLINNAGIFSGDSAGNTKISEFDRQFDTNVRAVVILTNLAVKHLEKTKGNIVNVSSVFGMKAMPGFNSYCVTKAAVDQFTKCCALDLAPKGIRVNAINPAAVRTPIFETSGFSKEATEDYLNDLAKKYPLGRVGVVEDTTNAIVFLASDQSSFLTGILLPVDGGSNTGTF